GEQAQTREAVRLDLGAESLGLAQELVQVRNDLLLRDRERVMAVGREAERPDGLDDEVAHAAIVGGAEDRLELKDVQPRDDDLLRDADADAERVGEPEDDGQTLQSLEQRL